MKDAVKFSRKTLQTWPYAELISDGQSLLRDNLMKNKILMDEYIPLGDTRYVFRISKYIRLMKK